MKKNPLNSFTLFGIKFNFNPNEIFIDGASSKKYKNVKEFLDVKGIGLNKGTKYSILTDYLLANSNKKIIKIEAKKLFNKNNNYKILDSIKDSNYLSPKFKSESVRILKFLGLNFKYINDISKEVLSDNSKGNLSGLLNFDLEKIESKK